MKHYIGLLIMFASILKQTEVIASDTPEPHRWYDNAQEVQIYKGNTLIHDLNWYQVDGNWYEDGQYEPSRLIKKPGLRYVIAENR